MRREWVCVLMCIVDSLFARRNVEKELKEGGKWK